MSEIKWSIKAVSVLPEAEHRIYEVRFLLSRDDESNGKTYHAEWESIVRFDPDLALLGNNAPFATLTEEGIVDEVKKFMGESRVGQAEGMVNAAARHQVISATAVDMPLPWVA